MTTMTNDVIVKCKVCGNEMHQIKHDLLTHTITYKPCEHIHEERRKQPLTVAEVLGCKKNPCPFHGDTSRPYHA